MGRKRKAPGQLSSNFLVHIFGPWVLQLHCFSCKYY